MGNQNLKVLAKKYLKNHTSYSDEWINNLSDYKLLAIYFNLKKKKYKEDKK